MQTWTFDRMEQVAEIVNNLNAIKLLGFKTNQYLNFDIDEDQQMFPLKFPEPNVFLMLANPINLQDWERVTANFLVQLPLDFRKHLDNLQPEAVTNRYYNEIPLYEAEPFVQAFEHFMKTNFVGGSYFVDIYALNDQLSICFPTAPLAETFAKLVAPATSFTLVDGNAVELSSF